MTVAVFLSYWTGLRFVAPDLDLDALIGTALALHLCDAIMCRLLAVTKPRRRTSRKPAGAARQEAQD